jgi:hypothetical protein
MEHVYLAWGLGGGLGGGEQIMGAIAALPSLDSPGAGHGSPLGATLVKILDEYAPHGGQAHMLRFAALGEIIR